MAGPSSTTWKEICDIKHPFSVPDLKTKDFNFLTTNYVCYRFFLVEELIILRNISSISSLLGNLSFLS